MRVLFDARVLTPPSGHGVARHGIARHARGLLSALVQEPGGHQLIVLVQNHRTAEAVGLGPEVRTAGLRPYSWGELVALPFVLAKARPQLYYSPTYMPPLWSPSRLAFTIHDLTHLDPAGEYGFSRALAWRILIAPQARRAAAILTGSRAAAEQIALRLRVARERIEVIGHGLEAAFHPRSAEETAAIKTRLHLHGPYLVALGSPKPHKNLTAAAAAFHRLAVEEFAGCLVVVGAGRSALPAGPGRVIRAEGLEDDDLAALLSGAEAAVFPSLAEGFGLPPLEAVSCLCPVVVSDLPVFKEVLGEEGAYFAPQGRPEALAEQLRALLADRSRARSKARAGQSRAAAFTWPAAAARLRAVFDRLEAEHEIP